MPQGFDPMTAQSWSHSSARTRPPDLAAHPARAAMLSSPNSVDCSFEHVDEASTVRPYGGAVGDGEGSESSASDTGAGTNGGAAGVAATGASSSGGAARGAGPGVVFEGRVVGLAAVYVQRGDVSMYVAPLLGPSAEGPYSWGRNRPIHLGTYAQARKEREPCRWRVTLWRSPPSRRQPRRRYGGGR